MTRRSVTIWKRANDDQEELNMAADVGAQIGNASESELARSHERAVAEAIRALGVAGVQRVLDEGPEGEQGEDETGGSEPIEKALRGVQDARVELRKAAGASPAID